MNLGQAFQRAVTRTPDAVAVVDGDRRQSFAEWYESICRVTGGLRAHGVRPGDHVAAVMKNRWEMATLAWASYMAGAVFTPVSWRGTADEIGYCLGDSGAVLCVHDGAAGDAVADACDTAGLPPDKRIAAADAGDGFGALLAAESVPGPSDVADSETALMLYTSGTTGRPKGVPRSHRAEWAATMSQIAMNEYPRDLAQLCVMPLFHTMGIRTLEASAFLGGKMVLLPDYSAEAVLDSIEQEQVGGIFLVPTMYHDILNRADIGTRNLYSVIRAGFAGMTMAPSLIEKCCATFDRGDFVNFYGSSEIYTLSVSGHQGPKPGNAGRPGLYQELRIVEGDPDRRVMPDEVVAPGDMGEIIVSMGAPDAFAGYWNRPDSNEKSIRDGWYYTGDLGQGGRGRRPLGAGPRRRHDHLRRREHPSGRGRGCAAALRPLPGRGRDRPAGRAHGSEGGRLRRAKGRRVAVLARRRLPVGRACQLQASPRLCFHRRHPAHGVGQTAPPQAARRRIRPAGGVRQHGLGQRTNQLVSSRPTEGRAGTHKAPAIPMPYGSRRSALQAPAGMTVRKTEREDNMEKYAKRRASVLEELDGLRVEVDQDKAIGWLILDRPPLNIVSYMARSQIAAIFEEFAHDDDVKVIVVRGANGVYTSGGDVKGFFDVPRDGMSHLAWNIAAPTRCGKPVICAMEKYAFGVGFELSLACDLRLATKETLVGLPEVTIGEIPGSGGTHRLANLIGLTRANHMIYLGERIPAPKALDWGILTDVAEDSDALTEMIGKVRQAPGQSQSPLALRTVKRVLNTAYDTSLEVGLELEGHAYEKLRDSHDYKEGADAFFNKRKPEYTGE